MLVTRPLALSPDLTTATFWLISHQNRPDKIETRRCLSHSPQLEGAPPARGCSDILFTECTEVGVESKSALRSLSRTPCDDLREFVDRHIDDMVFPSMKQDTAICDVNKDLETSSANQLLDDLEQFDSTLQTEHTAPPKSPTRHKNNKKKHSTNSEQ
ncbi:hypothetical protein J6590_039027 [Homalodisca vitripennis]|nr:hypothetical protein J6590_039027 [Homalodisca vitripennis]